MTRPHQPLPPQDSAAPPCPGSPPDWHSCPCHPQTLAGGYILLARGPAPASRMGDGHSSPPPASCYADTDSGAVSGGLPGTEPQHPGRQAQATAPAGHGDAGTGTHKATWRCGESEAGRPGSQVQRLGVSGRTHTGSSPLGLPGPGCPPDRWGHPPEPFSSCGVSEGMLGPGEGETGVSSHARLDPGEPEPPGCTPTVSQQQQPRQRAVRPPGGTQPWSGPAHCSPKRLCPVPTLRGETDERIQRGCAPSGILHSCEKEGAV